jgi:hypothetical protein
MSVFRRRLMSASRTCLPACFCSPSECSSVHCGPQPVRT